MPFRRHPHALHQRDRLIDRKRLPFAVVGNLRQVVVDEFDAAAVEELAVGGDRH